MDLNNIIERIGYFRNKANLSARALSLNIDKNPAYITKLEAGEFEPSMRVILEIIQACNITPEEFFSENIDTYKLDKETLNIIKNLPENKKLALKELLK
ncbi:MAG: helix-turn-helix transcriptional regulator [Clostridiales bacterium]|nr:helix-turn-helix transcriptional regulator [Clostridiales bacterium]